MILYGVCQRKETLQLLNTWDYIKGSLFSVNSKQLKECLGRTLCGFRNVCSSEWLVTNWLSPRALTLLMLVSGRVLRRMTRAYIASDYQKPPQPKTYYQKHIG